MARFKKLSLDEMRETFTLLSEAEQRAIKGGCQECDMYRSMGETIYSLAEYNAMLESGTWNGGYFCTGEHCICDLKTVEVIGYGSSNNPTMYGSHCLEHNLYFGMNSYCPVCSGANYGGAYEYPDNYSGNYGGNIGGGGSGIQLAPNTVIDMPSSIKDKFVRASKEQEKNLCVIACIAQAITTYTGRNLQDVDIINECARALFNYRKSKNSSYGGNEPLIAWEIKDKGVSTIEMDVLYDYFFTNVHIQNNNNALEKIDIATYEGDMVLATLGGNHNVIILDIIGNECTYYDPEEPDEYKKEDLKKFCMLRRITGLK